MIISLLHDSKDIPFWGAYECRFGSIGTLNCHFGTLVRPAEESYGIIPIPFRVVAMIAYGVSFSIFFRLGTV